MAYGARVDPEQISRAQQFGQSVFPAAVGGLRKASNFVKSVSPVREMYGAANLVKDFGVGLVQGFTANSQPTPVPTPLPAVPAALTSATVTPQQQEPSAAPPITAGLTQAPTSATVTPQQQVPSAAPPVTAGLEPSTQAPPPEQTGMQFSNDMDTRAYAQGGLREMLRSPAPNVANTLMLDPETGKYTVRESMQGSAFAPVMERPLSRRLFSGTAAEFAAANQAISDRNAQLMNGYDIRGQQWAAATGGVPKDVAQAGLYNAQAAAEPITAESAAGLRNAQADVAKTAKLLQFTEEVPTGFDDFGTPNPPRKVQKFFDPTTRTVIDPLSGAAQRPSMATAIAARAALPAAKQSIVDKHFGNTRPSAEEVMSFISTLK